MLKIGNFSWYIHSQSKGEIIYFSCWQSRPHLVKSTPLIGWVWPYGQNPPPNSRINRSLLTSFGTHINSSIQSEIEEEQSTHAKEKKKQNCIDKLSCFFPLTSVDLSILAFVWLRLWLVLEAKIFSGSFTLFDRNFALVLAHWPRFDCRSTSTLTEIWLWFIDHSFSPFTGLTSEILRLEIGILLGIFWCTFWWIELSLIRKDCWVFPLSVLC